MDEGEVFGEVVDEGDGRFGGFVSVVVVFFPNFYSSPCYFYRHRFSPPY